MRNFQLIIVSFRTVKTLKFNNQYLHFFQVEVRQIKNIQDDINDYIDNCQEPEFIENDYIYDDIDGLEEMLIDVSITYVSFFCYCKIGTDESHKNTSGF